MRMNCYSHSKMVEQAIYYPASEAVKGNVKARGGRTIEEITPRSKNGVCMRAVFDEDGNIALWVPA